MVILCVFIGNDILEFDSRARKQAPASSKTGVQARQSKTESHSKGSKTARRRSGRAGLRHNRNRRDSDYINDWHLEKPTFSDAFLD